MYWYVIFVRTGREFRVNQLLKELLNADLFKSFVPVYERIIKVAGTIKKDIKPLFPGYVFIESILCNQEFIKQINSLLYTFSDMICILRYSETEIALRESEKRVLENLYNDCHCIKSSSAIIMGDKIHVVDGPLKGYESIVRKVNRHKRQAWIEIDFMGNTRVIVVALEILEKI